MPPSRVAEGAAESPSSSGIFFQEDGPNAGTSQLTSNRGNSLHPVSEHARTNMGQLSGDVNSATLNNVVSSVPRVGVNSIVMGTNSGLLEGRHLQRNASFNADSHMLMPASPGPFASNNDLGLQSHQNLENQGALCATSLTISRMGQVHPPSGPRGSSPFNQDPLSVFHLQKKPRLDIKQEDALQQQVLQQLLQRHDPIHLQNPSPQLQALIQQQRLRQQQQREQQHLQSMLPMQRVQLLQQHQQQIRQQFGQQGLQPVSGVKRPYDGGVCSRRIMQYLYHLRQRPPVSNMDNNIAYWRKFMAEYYSPRAKKRWCLSLYDDVDGVFPQAGDAWQCDLCGSRSGKGFEAPFGVLARLNRTKFNSGVIDEVLFLGLPRESQFPSGIMMLEYAKAVQQTIYEQARVIHEGHLRIIFTPDLKILSWEFCPRGHEAFLPRRLVAPQVNRIVQIAQNCQDKISKNGPECVSQSDLQTHNAIIVAAGRQLARGLELHFLNEWGFSKRFGRFLQIVDVCNSMKDLMDFCTEQKTGPIDALKNFPRRSSPNTQMHKTEQVSGSQGLQTDQTILNNPTASNHGFSNRTNNNQHMASRGALAGPAQAALALTNYQNQVMRQNSANSTHISSPQPEASSPFSTSSQPPPTPGPPCMLLQNPPGVGFTGGQASAFVQGSQALQQQQMMQQVLVQDVGSRNNMTSSGPQQSLSQQNQVGNTSRDGLGCKNPPATASPGHGVGNLVRQPATGSNSFKAEPNVESPAVGNNGSSEKAPNTPLDGDLDLPDDFVPDITHDFADNDFLDELDDFFKT